MILSSGAAVGHAGPRVRLNPGLAAWGLGGNLSESDFRARHGGKESLVERGTRTDGSQGRCSEEPGDGPWLRHRAEGGSHRGAHSMFGADRNLAREERDETLEGANPWGEGRGHRGGQSVAGADLRWVHERPRVLEALRRLVRGAAWRGGRRPWKLFPGGFYLPRRRSQLRMRGAGV